MSLTVARKRNSRDVSFLFFLPLYPPWRCGFCATVIQRVFFLLVVELERSTALMHRHAVTTVPHMVQAQAFDHFMIQFRANLTLMIQPVSPSVWLTFSYTISQSPGCNVSMKCKSYWVDFGWLYICTAAVFMKCSAESWTQNLIHEIVSIWEHV